MSNNIDAQSGPSTPEIAALTDKFNIMVPSAFPALDEQELMLLRVLGRLELMTLQQIRQLIFPHLTPNGVQKRLNRLVKDELL